MTERRRRVGTAVTLVAALVAGPWASPWAPPWVGSAAAAAVAQAGKPQGGAAKPAPPTAEEKAAAAKVAAFEAAFKPLKDDAPLAPRQAALAALLEVDDAKAAKALLAGRAQLVKEVAALEKERDAVRGKLEELLDKLGGARGRPPKPEEKTRLEKLDAEQKALLARQREIGELGSALDARLGASAAPEALRWLLANVTAKHELPQRTREQIVRHAALASPPLVAELVALLPKASGPDELLLAIDGLAACGPAAAAHVKLLADLLWNEDSRVQEAALFALAELRAPEAIAPLVHFLGEQPPGAALRRATRALVQLTGVDHGGEVRAWRSWLGGEGAALAAGTQPLPPRAPLACFELPLRGLAFAFVIDCSESMLAERPAPGGGKETRLDAAKREVAAALAALPAHAAFTVVAYAHEARSSSKELQPATPENVAAAREWVAKITTAPKTVAATSTALSQLLQDVGAAPPPAGRMARLDAIVLITASRPVRPDGTPESGDAVVKLVDFRNQAVNAPIDAIALGATEPPDWLAALAGATGGRCVAR